MDIVKMDITVPTAILLVLWTVTHGVKETQENVPFVRIRITVQFVRIIVPLDVVISTATKLATVLVVKIHTMENNVKTIAL
jgi:hypothetical protein